MPKLFDRYGKEIAAWEVNEEQKKGLPVGTDVRFDGSVEVVSRNSGQKQFVPAGTKLYVDMVSGWIDEV